MAAESEQGGRQNRAAALGYTERQTPFATRMMNCVSRAFRGIGTSPQMEDMIFWNLSNLHGLGLNEIVDKPIRFIESMKAVFGEAGTAVFEYKLVKEVQAEFNLVRAPEPQDASKKRNPGELLQAAAAAAWMSA